MDHKYKVIVFTLSDTYSLACTYMSMCLQVLVCDVQHSIYNEVLAQILDLLCHLVNYGYYDDQSDINDLLDPLFELLDGRTDSAGKGNVNLTFLLVS